MGKILNGKLVGQYETSWSEILPQIQWSINALINSSTAGVSRFEIMQNELLSIDEKSLLIAYQ